jgi:putative hydrolase of the HAD superfamily
MKIKAIIFDCFGVIFSNVLAAWFKDHLGTSSEVEKEFDQYALLQDLNQMSEIDIVKKLAAKVGRSPGKVMEEIDGYLTSNEELVSYIRDLKKSGYTVGILSNGVHSFFERTIFTKHLWFQEIFSPVIISSQVGMVKPNKNVYEYLLKQISLPASEVVFIDDSQKNIAGAEAIGITGVFFTTTPELIMKLEELGVSI